MDFDNPAYDPDIDEDNNDDAIRDIDINNDAAIRDESVTPPPPVQPKTTTTQRVELISGKLDTFFNDLGMIRTA